MLKDYTYDHMPSLKPIPLGGGDEVSWWQSVKDWRKNARKFMVVEDWYYTLPCGTRIMIPKGFIFDGASVPRFLWPLLDPFGILLIPGLIHDFGYRYNFLLNGDGDPIMINAGQKHFDEIFLNVAKKCNGLFITNKMAWRSLRIFGRVAWNNGRKRGADVYWHKRRSINDIWKEVMYAYNPSDYYPSGKPRNVYLADFGGAEVA